MNAETFKLIELLSELKRKEPYLQTARILSVARAMVRKVVHDIRMFLNGYQKYGKRYTYTVKSPSKTFTSE